MTIQLEQIAQHIREDFDAGKLIVPSLPEVITRIRRAINDQKRGTQQVAKLIQLDPGLTARVIQIANSAAYRGSFPIDTCQMAISRLGMRTTRNLVTCLVMHNIFNAESKLVHSKIRELWKHSCKVAAIACVLAQVNKGQLDPDKALLAGLVHDIGVLPILHYAADIPELFKHKTLLDDLISKLRGTLGREILMKWEFDRELLQVPEGAENWQYSHGEKIDYVDVVIVAQIHSQFGDTTSKEIPVMAELPAFQKMSIARLGPGASVELLHEAQGEIQSMVQMLLG